MKLRGNFKTILLFIAIVVAIIGGILYNYEQSVQMHFLQDQMDGLSEEIGKLEADNVLIKERLGIVEVPVQAPQAP